MSEHILVAYYSWSGNTRRIAEKIHDVLGGEIHEIQPRVTYPKDYNLTLDRAKTEIRDGSKPELDSKLDDITLYRTVFIGSPNWWSTIAPPVAAFLSEYDLSEKKIVPFCTHGGGGQGRIVREITGLCPRSTVLDCFAAYGNGADNTDAKVSAWLESIGI
jgi:flavodoxin